MKTCYMTVGAVVATVAFAGAVQASSIIIDSMGGPLTLQAGSMTNLFGGVADHWFTNDALTSAHNALHADGISTDGFVTFLLADTADGLGFITLVDDETVGGTPPDMSSLGMSTTGPSSTDYWINDPSDDFAVSDPLGINTTVYGSFEWGDTRGDGFAWTNLQEGDGVTFNFTEMAGDALSGVDTFQFVTWNGEAWEVVAMANFNAEGQFAFSFTVVPLPAPVLLGLAGLAGVAVIRRRRLA